ncbi:MAG: hypothetical protein ACPHER_08075, partial [Nevskiales bacterium]
MHRESWGTRFGFIMAAAGSAVGLGNIWRFPYTTGEEGGGAFLLIYLACILILGLAVIMAELIVGRSSQRNPVGAFKKLGEIYGTLKGGAPPKKGYALARVPMENTDTARIINSS